MNRMIWFSNKSISLREALKISQNLPKRVRNLTKQTVIDSQLGWVRTNINKQNYPNCPAETVEPAFTYERENRLQWLRRNLKFDQNVSSKNKVDPGIFLTSSTKRRKETKLSIQAESANVRLSPEKCPFQDPLPL